MRMEKHVELAYLLDLYGSLLTQRQKSVLAQTVEEDCSLAEIAEREGISRQAVRDALVRAENQLYAYEASLRLLELQKGLRALRAALGSEDRASLEARIDALLAADGGKDGI